MVFKKSSKTESKKNTEESMDKLIVKQESEESNEESAKEKEEAAPKEKTTSRKTKKPDKSVENEASTDDSPKENGETTSRAKKTKTTVKKAPKKTKVIIPGERKSSRPHKPVTKEGDKDETFEVEQLVDVRAVRGVTQYLVRWKGYSRGDDSWEDEKSLTNCPELVREFKAKHPAAVQKAKKRKSASKSPARPNKKGKTVKKTKEEDYEVQEIVGVRRKGGQKQFLVRWKGFDESEDTWEPESNLDCPELIEAYLEEHKDENEELETPEVKVKRPAKKKKSPAKSKKSKKTKSK